MKTCTYLFALIMAVGGCKSERPQATNTTGLAQDFTLTAHDGKQVRLSDYKGRIVVLEWFNYECPFVKYHYNTKSTMKDLAAKYADSNVTWLAVNSTSHVSPEQNKAFADDHDLPYPILDDRSGKVGRAYNAVATPHMFVIDKDGSIAYSGAIDNAPMGRADGEAVNYVDAALTSLLAGKPISVTATKPYGCSVKYAD